MVPIARALSRPAIALLVLLTLGAGAHADGPSAPEAPVSTPATTLSLGAPIPPASAPDSGPAIGLLSLDANGATFAALRTDGSVLVETDGRARVVEPPANGEAFRAPIVAGDGIPVAVTTRGRIALLEVAGTRFLPYPIQRSAKPAAIPGSSDVLLGSENGSIRRLVRTGPTPSLVNLLAPGDEPVGTLAASTDRVVYARLDGVVLSIPLGGLPLGGEPTVITRPARAVRAIRFIGATAFAVVGGEWIPLAGLQPAKPAPCDRASEPADVEAIGLTTEGTLVALLADGILEVRRTSDGTRVRSDALRARRPTALAWSRDARTLWVATASDARPFAMPVKDVASSRRDEPTTPAPR